jgi:hypothetical protein
MKRTIAALLTAAVLLTGCNSAERVNRNLSRQANEFNVFRKLTVMNARTDTIMLEVSGYMALTNDEDNELVVTIRTGENTYYKDYIYLNDWTCYVMEQTEPSNTSRWFYEIIIFPRMD